MRIAFIANNNYAPWGGSEELWSLAALRLSRAKVPILAAVQNWWPQPPRITELRSAGVAIHVIRPRRAARLRERLRAALRGGSPRDLALTTIDEAVAPFHPDLVVISQMMNTDGTHWVRACRARALPYALIAQAASELAWPEDWNWGEARDAYAQARRAFFVSQRNVELTERQLGLAIDSAEVVCNPFLVAREQPTTWPPNDGIFRLACVARLEPPAKGHDVLFQVLAQPRWRSRPLRVSLFGAGRHSASVRGMSEYLGLPGKVDFAGHTNDIAAVWRAHHALVLASRQEGTPLALHEAMLCHRCAITTDVGGNAESIEDNVSGFVASACSVASFDEALERAWTRRNEWRELGLVAGRRVRSFVPADPAAVFADRLLAVAAKKP